MWSEVLRIKAVLDNASAKIMEMKLAGRFKKVTKVFSSGLKAAVSGTVLGIGLNLLAKILNPIQELEEKLDALLGKGKNVTELADRFNTDSGKVLRLQAVGERLGVAPEDLNKLMESYADAIETARDEIKKPLEDQSEATKILKTDFLGEKDLAEGFFRFMQSLKKASPEDRRKVEKEVLGEQLFGFKKRFADADFKKEFKSLPSDKILGKANGKVSDANEAITIARVNRETIDYIKNAGTLGPKVIDGANKLGQARSDAENANFATLDEKLVTARGTEAAMTGIKSGLDKLNQGIANLTVILEKMSKAGIFRNLLGGGK